MRTYLKTHPWINFEVDLRRFHPETWLELGEIESKANHLIGAPLVPAVQFEMSGMYLAKGALATVRIEGNTLTDEQAKKLVNNELAVPPSQEYLKTELENIVSLCRDLDSEIEGGQIRPLSVDRILEFNRRALAGLELPADTQPAGQVRTHSVGVGTYRGAPHQDCVHLLTRLVDWVNGDFAEIRGHSLASGLIRAIVAHVYIAWVHPFGDGNGRTARLVEFLLMLEAGFPSVAAHLLWNHYSATRTKYYRMLEKSSATDGGLEAFLGYAIEGFRDGVREQVDKVQQQNMRLTWEHFVYSQFTNQKTRAKLRQRKLLLELGRWVPIKELRKLPEFASDYAGLTSKAVRRDINELKRRGLLLEKEGKVCPRFDLMRSFLSPANRDQPGP